VTDPASPPKTSAEPEYGGFWIRFGAALIDTAILYPFIALVLWGPHNSRWKFQGTHLLLSAVSNAYYICCVGRWGGTPGKLLCGLRVVRADLRPAGWKESWLRHSLDLTFGILGTALYLHKLQQIPDAAFTTLTRSQLLGQLVNLDRIPNLAVTTLEQIWIWSEFLILLTNRKRRALHDFIAGTVVIRKPAPRQEFSG
jgi:uncharacterized RDD family membrane protein YckC